MLKKYNKVTRETRGSIIVENAAFTIVFAAALVFMLSFMPVITRSQVQNTVAHELARYIEVTGEVDSDTDVEFERLKSASTLPDADFTVDCGYGKIDLQEEFSVRVTSDVNINVGGIVAIPVTVVGKAAGRGEVYWK